jgi:vancomycin resistance protein YoaR
MPKPNQKLSDPLLDVGRGNDQEIQEPNAWQRAPIWLRAAGGLFLLLLVSTVSFELMYAGDVYAGVSADGVYLGGLSKSQALQRLQDRVATFQGDAITISNGNADLNIPVASLDVKYDTQQAVDLAFNFGREGSLWNQAHEQLRALFGHSSDFDAYSYADDQLVPFILGLDNQISTASQNATLTFNNQNAQVTPGQAGNRLDLGGLTEQVNDRLSQTSASAITAPVYQLTPDLQTAPLQAAIGQINGYVSAPITVSYSGNTNVIDQSTIISWIEASSLAPKNFMQTLNLTDLYPLPPAATLGLSQAAVASYVAGLASGIDQPAQNATLAMASGTLSVTSPSQNGVAVDQADAVNQIVSSLKETGSARTVNLKLDTTTAAVNENDLASLGITGLISEGETYFPESPPDRLINVRAGAARFNDVLLKPGEVFSFGAILGAVGPAQGYVPELVIDGNHEDFQYGGGLCQVSTTAFRAALLAGLPINERLNHAFAISYYTWPYGVPGVDATIYYPQVDLKFTNDTGHYILIQTIMNGDDLKFDFYGTKTKVGVIRGPYFVSGSNNATKASHTVFYRDVEDLTGKVLSTNTFQTYYQPSVNYPIVNTLELN